MLWFELWLLPPPLLPLADRSELALLPTARRALAALFAVGLRALGVHTLPSASAAICDPMMHHP